MVKLTTTPDPAAREIIEAQLRMLPPPSATLAEQLAAAFQRYNTVFMARDWWTTPSFKPDPKFDPMRDIPFSLVEEYGSELLFARSQEEVDWLIQRGRKFRELDRKIASGPLNEVVAGLIAGAIDPVNLLPLAWLRVAARGSLVLEGALAGAVATGLVEPLAHGADPFRTYYDTFASVLTGTLFGAGMGSVGAFLARGRVRRFVDEVQPRRVRVTADEASKVTTGGEVAPEPAIHAPPESGGPFPQVLTPELAGWVRQRISPDRGPIVAEATAPSLEVQPPAPPADVTPPPEPAASVEVGTETDALVPSAAPRAAEDAGGSPDAARLSQQVQPEEDTTGRAVSSGAEAGPDEVAVPRQDEVGSDGAGTSPRQDVQGGETAAAAREVANAEDQRAEASGVSPPSQSAEGGGDVGEAGPQDAGGQLVEGGQPVPSGVQPSSAVAEVPPSEPVRVDQVAPSGEQSVRPSIEDEVHADILRLLRELDGRPVYMEIAAKDRNKAVVLDVLKVSGSRIAGPRFLEKLGRALGKSRFSRYPAYTLLSSEFLSARLAALKLYNTGISVKASLRDLSAEEVDRLYGVAKNLGFEGTKKDFKDAVEEILAAGFPVVDGLPVQSLIEMRHAVVNDIAIAARRAYQEAVKLGFVGTYDEFDTQIGIALRYNESPEAYPKDPHEGVSWAPAVQKIVGAWTKQWAPLMRRYIVESGIWGNEEHKIVDRPNYWPKRFDRYKVLGDLAKFKLIWSDIVSERVKKAVAVAEKAKELDEWHATVLQTFLRAYTEAEKYHEKISDLLKKIGGLYKRAKEAAEEKYSELKSRGLSRQRARTIARKVARTEYYKNLYYNVRDHAHTVIHYKAVMNDIRKLAEAIDREVDVLRSKYRFNGKYDFVRTVRDWYNMADYFDGITEEEKKRLIDMLDLYQLKELEMKDVEKRLLDEARKLERNPDIGKFGTFGPSYFIGRRLELKPVVPERIATELEIAKKYESGELNPAKVATEITNMIAFGPDIHAFADIGLRTYFRARSIDFDPYRFQEFIDTSFMRTADAYVSVVARDTALFDKFKTLDPEIATRAIQEEAHIRQGAARTEEEKRKIAEEARIAIETVMIAIQQVRGLYNRPRSALGAEVQSYTRGLLAYNFVTRMGSALLAQFSDLAKIVLHEGALRVLPLLFRDLAVGIATGFQNAVRDKERAKLVAAAIDAASDQRTRVLYDLPAGEFETKFERVSGKMATTLARFAILPFWNDWIRRIAVRLVDDQFVRSILEYWNTGKLNDYGAELVSRAGVSKEELDSLAQVIADWHVVGDDGLYDSDLENWMAEYAEVAEVYKRILHIGGQRALLVPGFGDTPSWTQNVFGAAIIQFRRFVVASLPQLLIPLLQSKPRAIAEAMIVGVAAGALSVAARDMVRYGRVKDRTPAEWLFDSLDMSGFFSLMTEIDATMAKVLPGISLRYVLTGEDYTRTADRLALVQILGPSIGTAVNFSTAAAMLRRAVDPDANITPDQIRALYGLVPFNNLLWTRYITTALERELERMLPRKGGRHDLIDLER